MNVNVNTDLSKLDDSNMDDVNSPASVVKSKHKKTAHFEKPKNEFSYRRCSEIVGPGFPLSNVE
jgi:hypothetical protein